MVQKSQYKKHCLSMKVNNMITIIIKKLTHLIIDYL